MRYILLFLILFPTIASADDIEKTMSSVAKIETTTGVGTGVVIDENEDNFYVLTAAHVLGEAEDCEMYFYVNGEQSAEKFPGKVVWKDHQETPATAKFDKVKDLAYVKVAKIDLTGTPYPTVKKLAKRGSGLKPKDKLFSVGCPNGNWPSGFMGHAIKTDSNVLWFKPNIIPGRSGSPIFDKNGEVVVGIVIWYNVYTHISGAMSLECIHDSFDSHRPPVTVDPKD
jgi:S1-C subfamily serine protease